MESACRKVLIWVVFGSVLLLGHPVAWAVSLEFFPMNQTVQLGDPVMVEIVISGLMAGVDPSVSTFDLQVMYDPSVLTATGVNFGTELGPPGFFRVADTTIAGFIDFTDTADLFFDFSAQPASFTLAILSFATAGAGTSDLTFSRSIVGNAFGGNLSPTSGMGSVTVDNPGMPPVPEPSTILLFGTGLAGLAAWRMKKQYAS